MKKNKRFRIYIIILIIICIISIVKIFRYINKNKIIDQSYTQQDLDLMNDQIKNYISDKITPKGISRLYGNYKGENDLNDIYRSIYSFVNYLPQLSKKIEYDNNDSIISYYEKNKKDISQNIGITKQEDFVKFINYLKNIGYHGEKFIDSEIDSSTFKSQKTYFSFHLKLNFEELNSDFVVKLNFANRTSVNPKIYYSIIEE